MDSLRLNQQQQQHQPDHSDQEDDAIVQVESKEDASDAVRKVNGQNFNGGRIRVSISQIESD